MHRAVASFFFALSTASLGGAAAQLAALAPWPRQSAHVQTGEWYIAAGGLTYCKPGHERASGCSRADMLDAQLHYGLAAQSHSEQLQSCNDLVNAHKMTGGTHHHIRCRVSNAHDVLVHPAAQGMQPQAQLSPVASIVVKG